MSNTAIDDDEIFGDIDNIENDVIVGNDPNKNVIRQPASTDSHERASTAEDFVVDTKAIHRCQLDHDIFVKTFLGQVEYDKMIAIHNRNVDNNDNNTENHKGTHFSPLNTDTNKTRMRDWQKSNSNNNNSNRGVIKVINPQLYSNDELNITISKTVKGSTDRVSTLSVRKRKIFNEIWTVRESILF
jgi:hypothetical protein